VNLDTFTILVMAGAVVAISGISFIVNTVLRHNELYGRLWSIAFVAGILETVSYLVWAASPSAWWSVPIGNGALVLALAFMWSGSRVYNQRARSYTWLSGLVSLVVVGAGLVRGPDGGPWAGAAEMYIGVALFAALSLVETVRGALGRSGTARVLTIVFGIVTVYYAARAVVFLALGEEDPVFTDFFGTATTTFVAIVLVVAAAITLSVLQPANDDVGTRRATTPGLLAISGVTDVGDFAEQALDWLTRARRDREQLVLLELSIDNLESINTAFGRELGDQAIQLVGRTVCESAPTASLVGYLGSGNFILLTTTPPVGPTAGIAEAIQTALVVTPIDAAQGIRAISAFGIATTETHGYALADLLSAARSALESREALGSVRVATPENSAEPVEG
jgi:diguanylate cyclase (GGDEF)-like protein